MVAEIAKKLGYLPLAIYQAGAYICAQKLSLRRYLERFETNFDKLFGKKPPNSQVWRYRDDTVFTTWEISFRAIEEENKEAARLLLLCSFLSNNDIWYDMLCYGLEDSMDGKACISRNIIQFTNIKPLYRRYVGWVPAKSFFILFSQSKGPRRVFLHPSPGSPVGPQADESRAVGRDG
jgi:hypothetical protein